MFNIEFHCKLTGMTILLYDMSEVSEYCQLNHPAVWGRKKKIFHHNGSVYITELINHGLIKNITIKRLVGDVNNVKQNPVVFNDLLEVSASRLMLAWMRSQHNGGYHFNPKDELNPIRRGLE